MVSIAVVGFKMKLYVPSFTLDYYTQTTSMRTAPGGTSIVILREYYWEADYMKLSPIICLLSWSATYRQAHSEKADQLK